MKTQIRITVSVYVPVALIKKRLKIEASLYNILQVLKLLDKSNNTSIAIEDSFQLNLFDNLLGH